MNEKKDYILAEYSALRSEIIFNFDIINKWLFALLPFSGTIYIFAIKEKSCLLPLFGVAISFFVLFYVRARLAQIIFVASYINVFLEHESPFLNWETINLLCRQRDKKTKLSFRLTFTVLYFNAISSMGLAIFVFNCTLTSVKIFYIFFVLIIFVVLMLLASYAYMSVEKTQNKYVKNFKAQKNEMGKHKS